jgi:hypothetical protein
MAVIPVYFICGLAEGYSKSAARGKDCRLSSEEDFRWLK